MKKKYLCIGKKIKKMGIIRSIFLLILMVLFAGCRNNNVTISGVVSNSGGRQLYLKEVKPGFLMAKDSVIPDIDGSFSFRTDAPIPTYYMLSFSDKNFLTILVDKGEKVEVTLNGDSLSYHPVVKGSEGSSLLLSFQEKHEVLIEELSALTKCYYDSINSTRLPVIMDSLDRKAAMLVADFKTYATGYLVENINSMSAIFLLNQQSVPGMTLFDPLKDSDLFFRVDSSLYARYPESDLVIDFHDFTSGLRARQRRDDGSKGIITIGSVVPEIALPNPAGDTIRLSSTRGSVVLLDFWASWCPPCRDENPNLVAAYSTFHNRGFKIYQVSLDMKAEDWTEAISKDKTGRWIHVSDLRYKDSEVIKTYGLSSIPYNYLLDQDGKVIGINLRGEELQKKLADLFTTN